MQATEHGRTNDRPDIRILDRSWLRRILLEPQMRPRLVVVGQVLLQHPPQMPLAQHDHMVETSSPDRPDDSLAVAVLPGGAGRSYDLLDVQHL